MEPSQAYGPTYFQSANYTGYLERGDRYQRTACEIIDILRKLGRLQKGSRIVDYGCATGMLIEGLKSEGYGAIVGVDISKWAREQAALRGLVVRASAREIGRADVLIALDVLEHMEDSAIAEVFHVLTPDTFLARIPVSTDGHDFHLAVSRQDPTHINCKTKARWEAMFRELSYSTTRLHLFSIYDSPGVACLLGFRLHEGAASSGEPR